MGIMYINNKYLAVLLGRKVPLSAKKRFSLDYCSNPCLRDTLDKEGLSGYVLYQSNQGNITLTKEIKQHLIEKSEMITIQQKWLISEIHRLDEVLSTKWQGGKIIPLKGITLINSLYSGREYIRPLSDIDVLIDI